jgi:hypothetical protein
MTAIVTESDLRTLYDSFNTGDIDAFLEAFSPDARYYQYESSAVGRGLDQIRHILVGWTTSFIGAAIHDVFITHDEARAPEADGAVDCWHIDYRATGIFDKLIPGLDIPPTGLDVNVPFSDTVWIDGDGHVLRLENSMHIPALQA